MGSGFSKMKKQARQLQDQLSKMQEEMKTLEVIGKAGNGLVEITLNGDKEVIKVKINPECVDLEDIEGLEDLVAAAFQDGHKQLADKSPMGSDLLGNLPF